MPKLVECPNSGAKKQVMVSKHRKALRAQIAIKHEPGLSVTTLFLSSLKKFGTCACRGKNSQDRSSLERTLEQHPNIIQELGAAPKSVAAHGFRITKGSGIPGPLGLPLRGLQWTHTTGSCSFLQQIQKWRLFVLECLLKRADCDFFLLWARGLSVVIFCLRRGAKSLQEKKPQGGLVSTESIPLTGVGQLHTGKVT